jgi:hypothetical protein
MKTRVAICVNVINLNSTVLEEEVYWNEFGVFNFCVPSNYDISLLCVKFICF